MSLIRVLPPLTLLTVGVTLIVYSAIAPKLVYPSQRIEVCSTRDVLVYTNGLRRVPTGLSLNFANGYHGHLYPSPELAAVGIHVMPQFFANNRTIEAIVINLRESDYLIMKNKSLGFIVKNE